MSHAGAAFSVVGNLHRCEDLFESKLSLRDKSQLEEN